MMTELKKTYVEVIDRIRGSKRKGIPAQMWMREWKSFPGHSETMPLCALAVRGMEVDQLYEIEYTEIDECRIKIETVDPLVVIEGTVYRCEDAARIFLRGGRAA
jgi:hypothetical protein